MVAAARRGENGETRDTMRRHSTILFELMRWIGADDIGAPIRPFVYWTRVGGFLATVVWFDRVPSRRSTGYEAYRGIEMRNSETCAWETYVYIRSPSPLSVTVRRDRSYRRIPWRSPRARNSPLRVRMEIMRFACPKRRSSSVPEGGRAAPGIVTSFENERVTRRRKLREEAK